MKSGNGDTIDRVAVVRRHNVVVTTAHPEHVLTVGNGDFAYTADITGMQTFTSFHDQATAIVQGRAAVNTATMSSWGWHEMPNPEGYVLEDSMSDHVTRRGTVRYPDRHDMEGAMRGQLSDENRPGAWLNANPQRLDLGRIGLSIEGGPENLDDARAHLDLWSGRITSTFRYEGEQVAVQTTADPDDSIVAFRIESPLLADGRLRIALRFPYAHAGFFQTADWNRPEAHTSSLTTSGNAATILRTLDGTSYRVDLEFSSGSVREVAPHTFELTSSTEQLDLLARFAPAVAEPLPKFDTVAAASAESWKRFWLSGAAVDFGGTKDARASELERRVTISQYLTAVNSSGVMPPAETGLATNSWSGKSHLEMHFWHAAHFATWGRPELLERSLGWYLSILDKARGIAVGQGYPGARWPKQVGPDGRESPDPIGSFLVWQQPHVLYMLELVWRASSPHKQSALALEFAELVDATATFMAAFAEERDGAFHLLSPIMPAQEFYDVTTTEDPTYELASWWWGLEIAQRWRERSGLERELTWTTVQEGLAKPHIIDGHYTAIATEPFLRRDDHPSLLMALGVLPPTPVIDPAIMTATLLDVLETWEWPSAWGWDFPVIAMTASRLARPDIAIDALLRDEVKNQFTLVGHNSQMGSILPIYLPGNGSLLAAISMLATNGFPESWDVATEGFVPWP
ncbi:hypothetical protein ASC66_11410 [Leifsonia sp. Root4]|uniref:hypothetical protein n=1 Tax=Leifsonia sp. Root4 TaxID=1736525 RepID=UPI0006F2C86A|nr:hypothetical protein [Leifsonia sp. Root4]KQW05585.1 hypothetical protein ASC66_11410 [Leifsonia sp. Root4]